MTTSAPLASLVDRLAVWAAPLIPESGSLPPGVAAACHLQRLAARVGDLIDGTPSPLTCLRGIDVAFARLAEALPAIAPNPDLAADSVIDATEARHAEGLHLTALLALALSVIGVAAVMRARLHAHLETLAVLRICGATLSMVGMVFIAQA